MCVSPCANLFKHGDEVKTTTIFAPILWGRKRGFSERLSDLPVELVNGWAEPKQKLSHNQKPCSGPPDHIAQAKNSSFFLVSSQRKVSVIQVRVTIPRLQVSHCMQEAGYMEPTFNWYLQNRMNLFPQLTQCFKHL